uniref:Uncharacterized protein n=1 Tax=Rhizophora mucronata TaxID=61149 RepID=A0A2P2NHJ7_RHIMU
MFLSSIFLLHFDLDWMICLGLGISGVSTDSVTRSLFSFEKFLAYSSSFLMVTDFLLGYIL